MKDKITAIKNWLGAGSINVFGMPFAGKDTQSNRLAELLDANVLGGGEILRNSVIPKRVKKAIDAGELAPTKDYIRIVLPYLSKEEFAGKPLILSSVGRWHGEEPGVIGAAKDSGHEIKAVIFLKLEEEDAIERFKESIKIGDRGTRTDDDPDAIHRRFSEFREKTLPVIDFYRQKNLLIEIDGRPPIEEIFNKIIDELYELSQKTK